MREVSPAVQVLIQGDGANVQHMFASQRHQDRGTEYDGSMLLTVQLQAGYLTGDGCLSGWVLPS